MLEANNLTNNNKNILIETSEYDSIGNNVSKEVRDIDTKGYFLGHTFYKGGKLEWKCIHELDNNGKQICDTKTTSDRSIISVTKRKFDTKGNMLEFQESDEKGDLKYQYFAKYNDKSIIIEIKEFYISWFINERKIKDYGFSFYNFITYDSLGNLQSNFGYNMDEGVFIVKYDNKGNSIEEIWGYGATASASCGTDNEEKFVAQEKINFEIFAKSNDIKNITERLDKNYRQKMEYRYTFDQYGNWLTKTTYNERFHASGGVCPPTVLCGFGSLSPARTFVEPPPA